MNTHKFEKVFDSDGTAFGALYAAEMWLRKNGYSYGCSCAMSPIGILKGEYLIAKWRNLTKKEREALDGYMSHSRGGSAKLYLKEAPIQ